MEQRKCPEYPEMIRVFLRHFGYRKKLSLVPSMIKWSFGILSQGLWKIDGFHFLWKN